MKPHHTKDDKIGNLTKAVNHLRSESFRERKRQQKIKEFDKLPYSKQVQYWRKFIPRGRRGQHICFIRENDKIEIINSI